MSNILRSQLEVDGYDATTAAEIIKVVDQKPDDIAYEYLLDIVDSKAVINRYLAARKRDLPESVKPSAKAAIEKTRPPKWAGSTTSHTPSPGISPSPSPSAGPNAMPHPTKAKSSVPYARAFLRNTSSSVPKPAPAAPDSASSSSSASNRQYKIDSINDLDAAIRKLDLAANKSQPCDCMGAVHGLLEMAPNCLNCGKIVCNKQGLGSCSSCGNPLLPNDQLEHIHTVLETQRSAILSSMGKNALKAAGIDPKTVQKPNSEQIQQNFEGAQSNLDKLLSFQASEAQRTKIIDQAEDFETTDFGTNQWASPLEQARQLRNQQRQERKQKELQKIRQGRGRKVISINIKGDKVYEEVTDALPSDSESEKESEPKEKAIEEEDDAARHWDASKHNTHYTKPVYTSAQGVKLPDQMQGRDITTHSEQEMWSI